MKMDERDLEVVRFVVDRRPDASVDDVTRALDAVDGPTDPAAVEAVVARAGYEVLFRADGRSVLRPRQGRAAVEPASRERPGSGAPRPPHPPNPVAVAAAIVVLLVAVLAVVAVTRRADDGPAQNPIGSAPTETTRAAPPTSARIAPDGPGSDPGLAVEGVVRDGFDRETEGLGALPDVGSWTVVRGEWLVRDGRAVVSGGGPGGLNLATVDIGGTDLRAQVTLPGDQREGALAFRVVDDSNYWLVASAPFFGTVALVQVVDGAATHHGNSGLVAGGDRLVIGVNARGSTVEMLVDGAVAATATDPAPAGTALGLGTASEVSDGVFDDLAFLVT